MVDIIYYLITCPPYYFGPEGGIYAQLRQAGWGLGFYETINIVYIIENPHSISPV